MTSDNGGHWDLGLLPEVVICLNKYIFFGLENNFEAKSDTKILALSCKFLIFKTKIDTTSLFGCLFFILSLSTIRWPAH